MKFLFSILALLLTTKECDQKKSEKVNTSKSEIVTNEETSRQQQEDVTMEYTAVSRGSFKEVHIKNAMITVKNGRDAKAISKPCSEEQWNAMMEELKNIDVTSLAKLEAPTQKRFYDGAAIANFMITIKDSTYKTPAFDDGIPPKEIKALCDKILEISNKIKE